MLRTLLYLLLGLAILFFALWLAAYGSEAASPLAEVKETVEKLKKATGNRPLIRKLILERMDLDEMGKRSLGRHWRDLPEVQRKEYLVVFGKYVEAVYRKLVFESVEFLGDAGIKYLKERIDGEYAEVDIQIVPKSGDKISATFKLHLIGGEWKAYDVVVENISTVNNLRAQFDRIISQYSFTELLNRLRAKIKELDK